jgi:NAD(P)-dependent dehydrogenase (short-subunit alcohol dehydrogenase family)
MTQQLQDRVAIITGASNGIGRGIAEMFGAEGAKTVLVARRGELLDEVAAGIKAKGGHALAVPVDLTKEDALLALFAKVKDTYGRLDVLVNNAGIPTHQNTEDITLADWKAALDINITAAFLCAREAIRIMKAQTPKGGRIITSARCRRRRRGRTRCPTR